MMTALLGLLLYVTPISFLSLLEKGDMEFTFIHYSLAEAIYDSALTTSTDSAKVLWRLARVYVCKADVSPQEKKLELYRQAERFAFRCIQADSMESEGHTWRAAALGNIAMFGDSKKKIRLCYLIKKELDCSIRLNSVDDIAYSILGSFYMVLGNVSWVERQFAVAFLGTLPDGGYDEAERALRKAIVLAPNVIRHHFVLGNLYIQEDRNQEALEQFRQVMLLPVALASDRRTQRSAAELAKNLSEE